MTDRLDVGFIGLGDQGEPIARRIVEAGWPLRLWARRAATTDRFADTAAVVEDSPAGLGAACDLVGVCVVDDDDIRDVVIERGLLAAMRPGSILAIHSTLLPETSIEVAERARSLGVHVLDSPVSGGRKGAAAGTMTVMVGGDAEPLARARPVFETFCTTIAHLGPVGAGQMMKLLNNNLAYANLVMGINALELADRLGMDRRVASDIIRVSSGASAGFGILTDPVLFSKIRGPSSNLGKDVHHLLAVAEAKGAGDADLLPIAGSAAERLAAYAARFQD